MRSSATWNGASAIGALAEDILQEAFAKVVARPEQAPADESVIPWFFARCGTRRSTSFGVVELLIVRTSHSHVSLKRTKHPPTIWRRRSAPASHVWRQP